MLAMASYDFQYSNNGWNGSESVFFTHIAGFLWIIGLMILLLFAERVLIALAAYFDANSKGNRDALMWALLIGFLGPIPAIIYLFVRNSGKTYVVCPNCGLSHWIHDPNCPRCGAPNTAQTMPANPYQEQQAHRAGMFLIFGVILFVLAIVAAVAFGIAVASAAVVFVAH
ncbi:MAG: hypothetical protein GX424_06600 [Clostridiales bacterium]|jgi:hypothetical protein|nr:hypothetical protein [Clostridiales bacterium]